MIEDKLIAIISRHIKTINEINGIIIESKNDSIYYYAKPIYILIGTSITTSINVIFKGEDFTTILLPPTSVKHATKYIFENCKWLCGTFPEKRIFNIYYNNLLKKSIEMISMNN